ncbi:MAG: hypothetical protein SFU86_20245 [Pirellulaceae bacterium]|nr:hypothetical protein [Pirellulaceae bacterium]
MKIQPLRAMRWLGLPALALSTMVAGHHLVGDDSTQTEVVRIEEDWELRLANPDSNSVAPQVTCTTSPTANVQGLHVTFELNHLSAPDYSPGGLHLHVWNGTTRLGSAHAPSQAVLATAGETIRWTTRLTVWRGVLIAEIRDGHSTTWGEFGGEGNLRLAVQTDLENLNGYSRHASAQQSGVAFAGNRVSSLKLLGIRATLSTGETVENDADVIVHELEQCWPAGRIHRSSFFLPPGRP